MERTKTGVELDRRSLLLFGASGTAAMFLSDSFAAAAEVKTEELAPGVTLKTFTAAKPLAPVPGSYSKATLMEITWQPGAKFGPDTSKAVDICEISGAPLYVEIKGMDPFTLNPGDIYFCPINQTETDTNKSDKPSVMRIIELEPAA